nr:DnaB: replicative DNA helicase [uncultured bacterium]AMP54392.1 DnaB: replicative DNA helicase [uncultured bacterium]AMP54430.1 DnaB: replicative DNA helicase [uncultured bacterium]
MDEDNATLYNLTAEQAALGACLMSEHALDEVTDIITSSSDFGYIRHQFVYEAMTSLVAQGEPVDAVTVMKQLVVDGTSHKVGDGPYMHELLQSTPTAANGVYYAKTVAALATRRRLITAAIKVSEVAKAATRDIDEVVDMAQKEIYSVTTNSGTSDTVRTMSETLDNDIDAILNGDEKGPALSTKLNDLDEYIGGIKPGQLIIVAGRPGMGKSVFCSDIARSVSIQQAEATLFVSLEMSHGEVVRRVLAAESGVNLSAIMNGPLSGSDRYRVVQARDRIYGAPIIVKDEPGSTLASIRSTARKIKQERGLGCIVVDYLQLMGQSGQYDSRATEVAEISRGLKNLARELEVPIVAAAQLNRAAESRNDKRPQLSDLRESGSIEQDADIVILLHRPDYYSAESERAGEIDLILAKNRNGPIETVPAIAQLHFSRITNI